MPGQHSMTSALRNYWDDGRGPILLRYCTLSYGIAATEWLLNPQNLLWLFPSLKQTKPSGFDGLLLWALGLLPLVWLLVVISGIKKTGWLGIVLVFPVWWGMFWWIMVALLIFFCATGRDCI